MRISRSATRRVIGIAIVGLVSAAAAGNALAQETELLKAMKQAGSAKAAIAALPPYAFPSPSGEPQGYLIDVAALAFGALGVPKITAVTTTFDAMIPGLQARQFDFVPAGMNITSARCQVVVFSSPLTAQQDAVYVVPGNPKKLSGYASAAQAPDAKLAVLTGSNQEQFALKTGVKADQIVRVPDVQAGISAVLGGRADGFAVGQFSVPNASQRGVEMVVDRSSPIVGVGYAFRKDDVQTRDLVNRQLEQLRVNGKMRELYAKYGFTTWDTLAKVTKASDLASGCE
jgi:polar amino acid transport system substrate-binding protein